MEGDAGPQVVSTHDRLEYGGHRPPFYQYQFIPRRDHDSQYGSNQSPVLGRERSNSHTSTSQHSSKADKNAHMESQGWEGFSIMTRFDTEKGSHSTGKAANANGKEGCKRVRAVDVRYEPSENINADCSVTETCRKDHLRNQSLLSSSTTPEVITSFGTENHDTAGNLSLKLCSDSLSHMNDGSYTTRSTKRLRSSSPGSQSYPHCQVDDCLADLKDAKDYHRRHKVCEFHSKASQSIVQQKLQRFCQQCSRFHLLQEFDEGKRSCRRRLAGHNKRRRKSNSDLVTNCAPLPETSNGTDILSIVSTLTQLQSANRKDKIHVSSSTELEPALSVKQMTVAPSIPTALVRDSSSVLAFQSPKVLPPSQRADEDTQVKVSPVVGFSQEAIVMAIQDLLGAQSYGAKESIEAPSCNDWSGQSRFSPSSSSPEDLGNVPNGIVTHLEFDLSSKSSKINSNSLIARLPSTTDSRGVENTASHHTSIDVDRPSDSDDTRHPVEQNFFPTESGCGLRKGMDSRSRGSAQDGTNLSIRNQQLSDSLESSSDQSPASSSSCSQELSGRIIFKLCDPLRIADIPQNYKSQLQEWLSVTPFFMEGYMRPGCVLLTVFLSMPDLTWKKLVVDLGGSLERFVQLSSPATGIWNRGRILVQVEQQRALIVDGKVKQIAKKTDRPLLESVRPLAVIAGQEVTLTVRGYNLIPQTKIVCAYNGRYVLHEVPYLDVDIDSNPVAFGRGGNEMRVQRVHFPGGPSNVFGRFFIEVERDLLGNILPVIVADPEICSELRLLEQELDSQSCWKAESECYEDQQLEAMRFLHELGWIFQSTSFPSSSSTVSLSRFKGLLRFAVLHDWCALVKKLMDLLFVLGKEDKDEVLDILSEINLLHQAVKRKCKSMVDLLIRYAPNGDRYKTESPFTAVMKGPAGLTPLHIAASISGAEDIIDTLTNDPYEVGLHGWKSTCDSAGRTPEYLAQNSGNVSYVRLVEKKLLSKHTPVKITILDEDPALHHLEGQGTTKTHVSCKICRGERIVARVHPYMYSKCQNRMYRPIMMTMVAIAAICATVALLLKGPPRLGSVVYTLKWSGINSGSC